MKIVKLNDTTHVELTKVKGMLTAKTGKESTFDDAILWLIQCMKEKST